MAAIIMNFISKRVLLDYKNPSIQKAWLFLLLVSCLLGDERFALGQFIYERKPVGHPKWAYLFLMQPILFFYIKWAALKDRSRGGRSMMEQNNHFLSRETFIVYLSLNTCTFSNLAKWISSLQKRTIDVGYLLFVSYITRWSHQLKFPSSRQKIPILLMSSLMGNKGK